MDCRRVGGENPRRAREMERLGRCEAGHRLTEARTRGSGIHRHPGGVLRCSHEGMAQTPEGMSAGKGDTPRRVNGDRFRESYDRIFRRGSGCPLGGSQHGRRHALGCFAQKTEGPFVGGRAEWIRRNASVEAPMRKESK